MASPPPPPPQPEDPKDPEKEDFRRKPAKVYDVLTKELVGTYPSISAAVASITPDGMAYERVRAAVQRSFISGRPVLGYRVTIERGSNEPRRVVLKHFRTKKLIKEFKSIKDAARYLKQTHPFTSEEVAQKFIAKECDAPPWGRQDDYEPRSNGPLSVYANHLQFRWGG